MANNISWDREMRAEAKHRKQGLFSVGYETGPTSGKYHAPVKHETARRMFRFCVLITNGKSPADAFSEVFETE